MSGSILVLIVNYPQAMKSAIYGISEMLSLANDISNDSHFACQIVELSQLRLAAVNENQHVIVIIPPSFSGTYYLEPDSSLLEWIKGHYLSGHTICSVCAGLFILAKSIDLKGIRLTTHWKLQHSFNQLFPHLTLDTSKILCRTRSIMTAGGLMAWSDLGLEIVHRFCSKKVLLELGKRLVIDTSARSQQNYTSPQINFEHHDSDLARVQKYILKNYSDQLSNSDLAAVGRIGERTLLRRFKSILGVTPVQYVQRVRIDKAIDLLQMTNQSIDQISFSVGFMDVNAFRKVFVSLMDILPSDYRKKFKR